MKQIALLIIIALATLTASAKSVAEQADDAYSADNFRLAEKLYRQAAATDGTSATLYFNLGNTYYRLGQPGRAILYYQRALKLDPANEDAATNLAFVNSRITDKAGDRGSFMSKLLDKTVSQASSDGWAWTALGAFAAVLVCVAFYIFSANVAVRKVSFFGGIALLCVAIIAIVLAVIAGRRATDNRRAIIITPSTQLSTSPRQPKDKSEEAMLLHEGTLVEIIDSVATPSDSINPMWLDVRVDNTHRAWVSAKAIERI